MTSSTSFPLGIVIVETDGKLKALTVKDFKEEEIYKKCGLKKAHGFTKQTSWTVPYENENYVISMFGKTEGKCKTENKYDFPPPIDTTLFFGRCALVLQNATNNKYYSMSVAIWEKVYEHLFGGFEDITSNGVQGDSEEDGDSQEEEDELVRQGVEVTRTGGYVKDGFVVDSDEEDSGLENIGSELSEESYDYN